MTKYKKFINEKIAIIAKEKDVLDIGGGGRFTKWLAEYKDLFSSNNYKTFDFDKSTGADIIGDIHKIPLGSESVDAIICSSVLEHVEDPALAVREMFRILRPNGKLFVYVPSIYPYHARKGHYSDYWRFFDSTLRLLFKDFKVIEIQKSGGYFKALFFFIPFQHKLRFIIDPLSFWLDTLFKTEQRTTTPNYYLYAVK